MYRRRSTELSSRSDLKTEVTQPKHGFDREVLPSALVLVQPERASIELRIGNQVSDCDIRMFHEGPAHQVAVIADASGLAVPRDQQQASGLDRPGSEDERPCLDAEFGCLTTSHSPSGPRARRCRRGARRWRGGRD